MIDTYRTLAGPVRAELKVKGSRFIAEAFPITAPEEVTAHVAAIRKRAYDATHHCFAYRLGDDFRYSDGGEPFGTAGQPILRQIDAKEVTNTLVVVTRYFGGAKLGTGGLIRAYGDAAAAAMAEIVVREEVVLVMLKLRFPYDETSPAMRLIEEMEGKLVGSTYGDDTELEVAVRASRVQAFREAFVERLRGRGAID
ncbi:MAG: YigZ family protein [Rhodothermales bacterium]|nr:YigZ family protein [Rhodothermales bacterium]